MMMKTFVQRCVGSDDADAPTISQMCSSKNF